MKKITLVFAIVVMATISAFAQLENPVTWQYAAKKTGKNEAILYIKASIDPNWHLYSQNIKPGGPNKTEFTFLPSKEYTLVGKTLEPKPITKYEKVFKMDVSYFENEVLFTQKVKLNKATTAVKGKVEFMVCDDKQCLPPSEVTFSIPVK
ncbi:protein-disulfide reductase DsbD N-terminal domain-containing protein [Pedobacter xixiisoli]|uniref:Disulphide bond corrector protein DsbC n=1 Tax=Pedobacter xixiisoli TaxID=1476464 RepID=A0A286AEB1_9SPHI|nr:protein-disulfide reductase DsbD N-terminal domain-containing protein [Pedobacter xixiisoli]SOD20243.1 Disulphide bond corrector protein DsbC [Pedobacter xixiisoli]